MKYLLVLLLLSGCTTLKDLWPRAHDPVLAWEIVRAGVAIKEQDCQKPNWDLVAQITRPLAEYAELRQDPQRTNLTGLNLHIQRLAQGGSKTFCELGRGTALQRIQAAKTAVESR